MSVNSVSTTFHFVCVNIHTQISVDNTLGKVSACIYRAPLVIPFGASCVDCFGQAFVSVCWFSCSRGEVCIKQWCYF